MFDIPRVFARSVVELSGGFKVGKMLHLSQEIRLMMLEDETGEIGINCEGSASIGDCGCWVDVITCMTDMMITRKCTRAI